MKDHDGWLHIKDYCEKYGEKPNTVHKRVADGVWERGEHYSAPDGGECFINEARAAAWLKQRGKLK